ncbi:hypothetical protein PENTCL1PPCAC_17494, partial [Pristionchus entomophagus]
MPFSFFLFSRGQSSFELSIRNLFEYPNPYEFLLKTSPLALADFATLFSFAISMTREIICGGACLLQFIGPCTVIDKRMSWGLFGVQVNLHTITTALISLSFLFRLLAIINKTPSSKVVVSGAILPISVNAPMAFLNYSIMERGESYSVPAITRNEQISLAVLYFGDLLTTIV